MERERAIKKTKQEGAKGEGATVKPYVETPLMSQYYKIKAVHPDAILLFRVGDFYETFGEDAIRTSEILGITLTKRANGAASFVELAGFPFHAVDTYLPKLVRAGARVAICEQLEDPKQTKGLVKRGVVELVTPGVVMEENTLSSKENRFLASVYFSEKSVGVAFLDISTGEFFCGEGSESYIDKLISNFAPKEVLHQRSCEGRFKEIFSPNLYTYKLDEWLYSYQVNRDKLCSQFKTKSLKGFGIEHMHAAISAAGAALSYLEFTEHKQIAHINTISRIDENEHVWIDRFTIRNLELFESGGAHLRPSSDKRSIATDDSQRRVGFANVIDRTLTPMGGRMLRRWISLPSRNLETITKRQNIVEGFVLNRDVAYACEEQLALIGDMERIAARVAAGKVTPRELVQLRSSIDAVIALKKEMSNSENSEIVSEASAIESLLELRDRLATHIYAEPNNNISKGGVIADGVDAKLDDLRRVATSGKDVLQQIVERESKRTGIPSLKISFNNIFGYYIEVRNTHKEQVPPDWTRKQTLTSAERYITSELKEYEEKIIGAENHILSIEYELYNALIEYVSNHLASIKHNCHIIAKIDIMQSFARMACEQRYVRPQLNESTRIEITQGRHPVIEMLMPVGERYIPNDIILDEDEQQIIMVTGPNMSGKSALLRQTALIILMAQIGSFVPATSANIGLVDKIFTRVGASDNISQGESTFMVEMLESASILNNISNRSVVLLDEIGRGTSTYDGISIAWAMVEYLHNHPTARAKTLFATHYHELNEMESICERVKNYHVTVKEVDNTIIFVRRLERGSAERSFGIHVARMAGMPQSVVKRANEILHNLELIHRNNNSGENAIAEEVKEAVKTSNQDIQLSMFQLDDPVLIEIRDQIKGLNLDMITPLEALNTLAKIKRISGL